MHDKRDSKFIAKFIIIILGLPIKNMYETCYYFFKVGVVVEPDFRKCQYLCQPRVQESLTQCLVAPSQDL